MMKYVKAEAEIIKFDNSDIVMASICQDENSVGANCANGGNYETQAARCRNLIWWVVQAIVALINDTCKSNGWWFSSAQSTADTFEGDASSPVDF